MGHDQNFKHLILDYPLQALQLFAAPEAQAFSTAKPTITPARQEQLKQRLGDRFRALDIPLHVEWRDGHQEAILFAIEEESQTSRFSVHRLVHYCVDLAEMYDITRVVPVVIFLGKQSRYKELNLGGEQYRYLHFWYLSCALSDMPWQEHQNSNNLVACLNLPNMQHQPEERIDVHAKAFQGLMRLEQDINKQAKYLDFIDIYSNLSNNELQRYQEKYPQEVSKMSNFASRFEQRGVERGMAKGMQQGLAQGLEQGKQAGEATLLLRQIELKFGKPSWATQERVKNADCDTLLLWSERILTAPSLEAILY